MKVNFHNGRLRAVSALVNLRSTIFLQAVSGDTSRAGRCERKYYAKGVPISGPITRGNRNWNQYQANQAHKALLLAGFAVYNPMPTGVLPFSWDGDIGHDMWLASDFEWIKCCDMVIRLPGESVGADAETSFAKEWGVPVGYPDYYTEAVFQANVIKGALHATV